MLREAGGMATSSSSSDGKDLVSVQMDTEVEGVTESIQDVAYPAPSKSVRDNTLIDKENFLVKYLALFPNKSLQG